jgi:hypothetical protein
MTFQEAELIVNDRPAPPNPSNCTLDDAIELLQGELERLKLALETFRRLDHPRRNELVRWHVRSIDRRQDALDQLHAMVIAERQSDAPIH